MLHFILSKIDHKIEIRLNNLYCTYNTVNTILNHGYLRFYNYKDNINITSKIVKILFYILLIPR